MGMDSKKIINVDGDNMTKEESIINYYSLCNKLKNIIRTGWKAWNVKRDRIESVAEHIYGTQMLAIAMKAEYNYDIDISKVIYMLAIHELGEIFIGDLIECDIEKEEKEKKEHQAVHKILSELLKGKEIEKLFLEFDERKTPEAIFAYQCDKLECDLQCKLYDMENCVDLNNKKNNYIIEKEKVKKLLNKEKTWSNMWLTRSQEKNKYDKNFLAVSKYALRKMNK